MIDGFGIHDDQVVENAASPTSTLILDFVDPTFRSRRNPGGRHFSTHQSMWRTCSDTISSFPDSPRECFEAADRDDAELSHPT